LLEFAEKKYGIPEKYNNGTGLDRYYHPSITNDYANEMLAFNKDFIDCIDKIKKRHSPTTTTIASGVIQLKEHWKRTNSPLSPKGTNLPLPTAIQSFLDNFYMSRIGIRMLIGQHIAVSQSNPPKDYVGIICTKTNLSEVVADAISNAQMICQDCYSLFQPPNVQIIGLDQIQGKFMYVPSHLHHMLCNLIFI
jgi:pyruvate dehydrogenase kinase 2/3/4